MKKIFKLKIDNKTPERQADSIKYEVKKYIKRERKKDLPEGADYWDFDCKIGLEESNANIIHSQEINPSIDKLLNDQVEAFYLEIIAKPGHRAKKPQAK
ncbi:DUF6172 family protein [Halobacteriovorax sp. HLS]|uniref:DUF6172 family protein n=1 Tax=Halobacteriovorax sp. HLS TaxID=2234000 RepID=UPI000FD7EA3F|nr:DUF6172 family protein [Halobacteriovorax sp. HLS]